MIITRPMKATSESVDPGNTAQMAVVRNHLPLLASIKLDGIRGKEQGGAILSNTMKPLPNLYLQHHFPSMRACANLDGEMILGDPTDPLCYNKTSSAVMKRTGEPDLKFYVFDWPDETMPFEARLAMIAKRSLPRTIVMIEQKLCRTWNDVLDFEERAVEAGHEGIILRRPDGRYKCGRATLKEGYALKFKRMEDSECVIIDMIELQHNLNEQVLKQDGTLKRSSHKAGKMGGGTLGTLLVRDIHHGWEVEIGTFKGFDAAWRQEMWDNRDKVIKGKDVWTYKFFRHGMKDLPRHPVLKGLRYEGDM